MPVSSLGNDPPTFEEYAEWYEDRFYEELYGSPVQNWYRDQTELGQMRLSDSEFWRTLLSRLESWNANYSELTGGYPLWLSEPAPMIMTKPFDSVIHKSWRWNVLGNGNWPDPPGRPRRSTAPQDGSIDRDDKFQWFGPHNWLTDFPDIFRTRLVTTYFDGVGNLANNVEELGKSLTPTLPEIDMKASHEGYHAVHVGIYQGVLLQDYETRDHAEIEVQLEIQVMTSIHQTINQMLHQLYEDSRSNGAPENWEWDHTSPEFSVNYLGNTLHYLEGMILTARDRRGGRV